MSGSLARASSGARVVRFEDRTPSSSMRRNAGRASDPARTARASLAPAGVITFDDAVRQFLSSCPPLPFLALPSDAKQGAA